MVSRDRAHVSTCPLIFQYYNTSCTTSTEIPVLVHLVLVRWHFESPTFGWEERDDNGETGCWTCHCYIYIYKGWGLPDDEKKNLWRMKACKGRRSTDAWSYSEEKLITDLRKYIVAFPGYMSYFPLPYYLSKYRQGKYTHKASKVHELVLNCLFLETSWANIVTCSSFSTYTDKRNIWGSVPLRHLEVASVIMKNLRPLIPCGTLQSLPHTTHRPGRPREINFMSRYICFSQNGPFDVSFEELFSKAKNPGGFFRKIVF